MARPFARYDHMVQNLSGGTSETKADQDGLWYELLCFGSPKGQLASQRGFILYHVTG